MNERTFLAIEIGGTKLQFAVGRADGEIVDRVRAEVDRAAGAQGIRQRILAEVPALMERWRPCVAAVGYGGPVDSETGSIVKSHQIAGWDGFPLRAWLEEETRLPAVVENDSNCAALAEAVRGAGRGCDPVFYINMGSGVGGGLVVNRAIYHGAPPGEAEIGHVRLDGRGTILEDECSGWAVDRKIRERAGTHAESWLAQQIGDRPAGGEARLLGEALERRDAFAEEVLEETAGTLAFALSHAVHLLHPAIIVVGGGLALLGEPLRAAIARQLPHFVTKALQPAPVVAIASLLEEAVPVGALLLAGRCGRKLGLSS